MMSTRSPASSNPPAIVTEDHTSFPTTRWDAARWHRRSPCTEWDARGVLEHVIGFHEVLLLRPLGVKAHRPRDDIPGRWARTQLAIFTALDTTLDHLVELPEGATLQLGTLLPMLTTDVLVHTWDLAKAVGADVALDPALCQEALDGVLRNEAGIRRSGMYADPVEPPPAADLQALMVSRLGRDPAWAPPPG